MPSPTIVYELIYERFYPVKREFADSILPATVKIISLDFQPDLFFFGSAKRQIGDH